MLGPLPFMFLTENPHIAYILQQTTDIRSANPEKLTPSDMTMTSSASSTSSARLYEEVDKILGSTGSFSFSGTVRPTQSGLTINTGETDEEVHATEAIEHDMHGSQHSLHELETAHGFGGKTMFQETPNTSFFDPTHSGFTINTGETDVYIAQYYKVRDLFCNDQIEECGQELDRILLQPNLPLVFQCHCHMLFAHICDDYYDRREAQLRAEALYSRFTPEQLQNKAVTHLRELLDETKTALIQDTPRAERFDKDQLKEIEDEEAEDRKEALKEGTAGSTSGTSSSVSTPRTAFSHMTNQVASTSSNLSTPATQFSDLSLRPSAPAAVYPASRSLGCLCRCTGCTCL